VTVAARRLPGIRFEAQPPPSPDVLPRMDVAGFVGFAASGPIGIPVAVEDAAQFAHVFGADAPLAWDRDRGEQAYALLGPAVRAFFRNGGRRCWVVRVADERTATSDSFPVPGLLALHEDGSIRPALLRARSPGSWADGLRVSASATAGLLRLSPISPPDPLAFEALVVSRADVVPGDLIRVRFAGSPWTLVFVVGAVDTAAPGAPVLADGVRLERLTVTAAQALWVRAVGTELIAGAVGSIRYFGADGEDRVALAAAEAASPADGGGLVRLSLAVRPSAAPPPGAVVEAGIGDLGFWLHVTDSEASMSGGTTILGEASRVTTVAPSPHPALAVEALVERLWLDLEVEGADGDRARLGGLGLAPAHPRYLGALPTDEELYVDPDAPPAAGTLAAGAAQPRFPLAGTGEPVALYLPLGSPPAGRTLGALRPRGLDRVRDGLAQFGPAAFLDPALRDEPVQTLLETAAFLRWQSQTPRRLRGIHALLEVEEVTLVCVPDAVQPGWQPTGSGPVASPPEPDVGSPPEPASPPDAPEPPMEFFECARHVPSTPVLTRLDAGESGSFRLGWSPTDVSPAAYELEESLDPGFATALTLYRGPDLSLSVPSRPQSSTLYYRVRASAGGVVGEWSSPLVVRTAETARWFLRETLDYSAATLLEVQLALLRMCAARGDLLAVLALPEHYRERAAVAHVRALKAGPAGPPDPILGYGALYHPWLHATDPARPAEVRRMPPDGAATGVVAGRALARGAWIAPANEPLPDVVELDPPLAPEAYQALQDAQLNVVRHEPGGFLWLAADTLSDDEEVRPIGVRRLLQLLRRTALLHGPDYAFEPNDDVLRRTIQRRFERLLSSMFSLGAFAGRTADESFRVETSSPPNTPQSVDAGRLIVELQVAPSRPLTFLTVRLVRTGAGRLQVEAR
jgi:hypothetical protein